MFYLLNNPDYLHPDKQLCADVWTHFLNQVDVVSNLLTCAFNSERIENKKRQHRSRNNTVCHLLNILTRGGRFGCIFFQVHVKQKPS